MSDRTAAERGVCHTEHPSVGQAPKGQEPKGDELPEDALRRAISTQIASLATRLASLTRKAIALGHGNKIRDLLEAMGEQLEPYEELFPDDESA